MARNFVKIEWQLNHGSRLSIEGDKAIAIESYRRNSSSSHDDSSHEDNVGGPVQETNEVVNLMNNTNDHN